MIKTFDSIKTSPFFKGEDVSRSTTEERLINNKVNKNGKNDDNRDTVKIRGERFQARRKRSPGVFFGLAPTYEALWDGEEEKETDAHSVGKKKGSGHNRKVSSRTREGKRGTRRKRNRVGEKDWNSLPDIWRTLGKEASLTCLFLCQYIDSYCKENVM